VTATTARKVRDRDITLLLLLLLLGTSDDVIRSTTPLGNQSSVSALEIAGRINKAWMRARAASDCRERCSRRSLITLGSPATSRSVAVYTASGTCPPVFEKTSATTFKKRKNVRIVSQAT